MNNLVNALKRIKCQHMDIPLTSKRNARMNEEQKKERIFDYIHRK